MDLACQAKVARYTRQSPYHKGQQIDGQCARAAKPPGDLCAQHKTMEARGYWIIRMGDVNPVAKQK